MSSSEQIHGAEGAWGTHACNQVAPNVALEGSPAFNAVFITSNSLTASDFSDALTDSSISDIAAVADTSQEAASDEVECAVSDCGGAAPSAMLQAFASVQSWGRSAGEKGTDHYGAGYHTRVYEP